MSLFAFNPFRKGEELTPPQLRQPNMTAWMRVLLRPLKYLSDLFTIDYCQGSNAPIYNNATTYSEYDRIIWTDNAVYELQVNSSVGVTPTGSALGSTNWRKVLECFIGADERVMYNGQLIVIEQAINKWFHVTSAPYIYVTTAYASGYGAPVIHVPTAVWTSLGNNSGTRDNRIRQFAAKYTLAGQFIPVSHY